MGEELYPLYFEGEFHQLLEYAGDDPFWNGMALLSLGRYDEVGDKIGAVKDEISKKYLQSKYLYATGQRQKSLDLSNELLKSEIADFQRADLYRISGNAYFSEGKLNKSINYQKKAIELFDKLGLNTAKYGCYIILGGKYYQKGEYDRNIVYLEQSLEYFEQNLEKSPDRNRRAIIICHGNLGLAKFELQEFDECLRDMTTAVDMSREYWMSDQENQDITLLYATCLTNLIEALIHVDSVPEAQKYLKILDTLPEKPYRVKLLIMQSSARMLLTSNRIRDHYKAEAILQTIISDPQIDFEGQYIARKMLFKILLSELQQTGEKEVLDEIMFHLEKQLQSSTMENIPIHRLEVILIRSRIGVINSNLENALYMIDQVIEESKALGYNRIHDEAVKEKKFVENEIQSVTRETEMHHTLIEKIQSKKLQDYIKKVKEELSH